MTALAGEDCRVSSLSVCVPVSLLPLLRLPPCVTQRKRASLDPVTAGVHYWLERIERPSSPARHCVALKRKGKKSRAAAEAPVAAAGSGRARRFSARCRGACPPSSSSSLSSSFPLHQPTCHPPKPNIGKVRKQGRRDSRSDEGRGQKGWHCSEDWMVRQTSIATHFGWCAPFPGRPSPSWSSAGRGTLLPTAAVCAVL